MRMLTQVYGNVFQNVYKTLAKILFGSSKYLNFCVCLSTLKIVEIFFFNPIFHKNCEIQFLGFSR